MTTTRDQIHCGMERQLRQWRAALAAGDERLGWKIGFNRAVDQQKLDLPSPMIGYLTRQRRIAAGGCYGIKASSKILVEAEIALLIGRDVTADTTVAEARSSIVAYAPALELVDLTRTSRNEIDELLAGNLFHDAVVMGEPVAIDTPTFSATLTLNGTAVRTLEEDRLPDDFGSIIVTTSNILAQHGERLQAGDWIISGAATAPVEIHGGDEVALTLFPLGELTLTTRGI